MRTTHKSLLCLFVLILLSIVSFTEKIKSDIVDYYDISQSIDFNGLKYRLSWSSHPNNQYYKQEYIPQGNSISKFEDMVVIDFLRSDITLLNAVQAQIKILTDRKKTDAVCNYNLVNSPDGKEYILDFLMSEGDSNGISILEWNAYHYKVYVDKAGHKGVLLFGVSHRAYDDKVQTFLASLKTYRDTYTNALIGYSMPEIQVK